MYAVVRTGGKQERVAEGQQLRVERLGAPQGAQVELAPVLVVDDDRVLATPDQLAGVVVSATVVGEELGPKTRHRRRWGHRQRYSTVQITSISLPSGR